MCLSEAVCMQTMQLHCLLVISQRSKSLLQTETDKVTRQLIGDHLFKKVFIPIQFKSIFSLLTKSP